MKTKKISLILTEFLFGSASAKTTSALSSLKPSDGIVLTSSTALLKSFAIINTKEYISRQKPHYTELRDGINVDTLLYEINLKYSMVDKKNYWERNLRIM